MEFLDRVKSIVESIPTEAKAIILIPSMSDKYWQLCERRRVFIAGAIDRHKGLFPPYWREECPDVLRLAATEVHELHLVDVPIDCDVAKYAYNRVRSRYDDSIPLKRVVHTELESFGFKWLDIYFKEWQRV